MIEKTIDLFFDTVGCILAGSSADGIRELKQTMGLWAGDGPAKVFSFDERMSAPSAAFLNSVMGHANDFDDTHDSALNHGCVTLVPSLLAVCEMLSAGAGNSISIRQSGPALPPVSGKEFIAALAVGLDISNRLGMAFIPYLHVGWLPTTLWGPFACAAACGRFLKLSEEQMSHAFGLAYSQIHGNRQALVDGALAKRVQPGFSASAGIQAAFFALSGITAARRIIGGEFGIPALFTAGRIDGTYLTEELGRRYETRNISIKPYPSCRCTHPVIDAAMSLKEHRGVQAEKILSGTVYLPPQSMGQIGHPFQVRDNPTVDAQFSAPYTAALTFLKGRPGIRDFREETVRASKPIMELASRFKTVEFESHNSGLAPIEMALRLEGGREERIRIEHPKGSPDNPLARNELLTKFNDCLDNSVKTITGEQRVDTSRAIFNVLSFQDMSKLIDLI